MARGISRDAAIAAFRGQSFGSDKDAREAADKLLNAMAEGNKDPLNRMGKLIAQGFEEKATPVITAAQSVARSIPGIGDAASSVIGGAVSGGAIGAAGAGVAAAAQGLSGLFMGAQQAGNEGFIGAPTFAGASRANFEGRFQSEDFVRRRALDLGPLNFSNVDKGVERFENKEAAKRRALEDEPRQRVQSYAESLARMGIDVDDKSLDAWFKYEQPKTARSIDMRERLGNIASARTEQFIRDRAARDAGTSAHQNSFDGKR